MIVRVLICAVLTFVCLLGQTPAALAAHCEANQIVCPEEPNVQADQGAGAVVTEGVAFPGGGEGSVLGRATDQGPDCPECEWMVAPACLDSDPTEDATCRGALNGCSEPDEVQYRVYMRRDASSSWQLVDVVCLGPGERPPTVADVGEIVRERVVNLLPDAAPSFQPAQGGLVNLPTIFAAGEPRRIETEAFDVLGFRVVVTATARWVWTFDHGVTEEFIEPGGVYPDDSVAYTYARTGTRDVSVTTYWRASFTVDGDGPFPVPGPEISKTAGPIEVPVREARAVLVGG